MDWITDWRQLSDSEHYATYRREPHGVLGDEKLTFVALLSGSTVRGMPSHQYAAMPIPATTHVKLGGQGPAADKKPCECEEKQDAARWGRAVLGVKPVAKSPSKDDFVIVSMDYGPEPVQTLGRPMLLRRGDLANLAAGTYLVSDTGF